MKKKKIMAVVGTRPDAVKMCPLINELRTREDISVSVCATGQHRELLSDVLDVFSVTPDYDLKIMRAGQDLFDITSGVMLGLRDIFARERPDAVLVHGDTTSAFAAALAAFYEKIPVCHVEAGLRTYDLTSPYPEEFNRRAIALMASHHFAPTETARQNLIFEGEADASVSVTGNTVVDALRDTVREEYEHPLLSWTKDSRLILLTAHRRENQGEAMRNIFLAVRRILDEYADVKVIYPVHPSPAVTEAAKEVLGDHPRVRLSAPLGVGDFHNFLSRSYLVLTDSGGVQEEAASMGKPTLVIRNTTERQEGILSGGMRLIGTGEGSVYRGVRTLLDNRALYYAMSRAKSPFGDGGASERISDIMEKII
ncbi:MAG: UDP-N-acetylglucosamine 2-epimerase (non-hydrolyzing) [Clostridia bacterium]|nr:UDP-N-acetylglucosamine 2-epimerase (non-hydrolyzing) [Clostridia bacterium]